MIWHDDKRELMTAHAFKMMKRASDDPSGLALAQRTTANAGVEQRFHLRRKSFMVFAFLRGGVRGRILFQPQVALPYPLFPQRARYGIRKPECDKICRVQLIPMWEPVAKKLNFGVRVEETQGGIGDH
ncbi:hypothetical protein [Ereboglobus luteus]|uniref:hypothetical protein n=1 Tax=Ereboglobus luteus TaxID=1796921 RepID=UPI001F1A1FEB|nr:hypothetical protein [Ereboglobus luteus]